jgi:hypothetical protein
MKVHPRMIYGWEGTKAYEIVISIMRGMIDGDEMPPVKVEKLSNVRPRYIIYGRDLWIRDGGHHRWLSAFLLGRELEVLIMPRKNGSLGLRIPCDRMSLDEGYGTLAHFITNGYKYSPLPSEEDFFGKYSQINGALAQRLQFDFSLTPERYRQMLASHKGYLEMYAK